MKRMTRKTLGLIDMASEKKSYNQREQYMLYSRGFSDGASMRAVRHPDVEPYERGYQDGRDARARAVHEFCESICYKPTILRTAGTEAKTC